MLDNETRRRIDTARDILVGKLPDPKSQVEQITIALIYKFMDDMDKEAVSFGGESTFFTGEWEKYSWTKIFDPKIGGFEMLNLYQEAIMKLNQNPNIPQLFRDIFKNAYLPYRDPETLKLFLKTINEFHYDHSEKLGDAFEYLLSVLGSQGDAGQFRTPRHIIDFIVAVLQPKKNETLCDPACGTAGFLISSYKYILQQNTKKNKGDLLTPDDKKKMMQHFVGYDISPDMVRLSLVNMYLHNFTTPKVFEYDTLTSEDRWNESFDIIMANPPFMSPKGGIKPHKKFTMQANRSEVLFVDYIAEHINPTTGRAGVIVPEGIIFQSANAYKQLRQMLVDKKYLYAVVSLPAGIFQPYSGVKTSILFMDRALAKKTDNILFVKIENDGFDLGAQRRAIDKNDLTAGLIHLQEYRDFILNNASFISANKNAFVIDKKTIKGTGDYNLSVERYRINENVRQSNFDMVRLGDLENDGKIKFLRGQGISKKDIIPSGNYKCIHYGDLYTKFDIIIKEVSSYTNFNGRIVSEIGDVLVPSTTTADALGISIARALNEDNVVLGGDINIIRTKNEFINSIYLAYLISTPPLKISLSKFAKGANILHLSNADLKELEIPLPPLSIQQQIVSKIEGYQAIINGAKQVVENYKPQIEINVDWETVKLGEVCEVIQIGPFGTQLHQEDYKDFGIPIINPKHIKDFRIFPQERISKEKADSLSQYYLRKGDVIMARRGEMGRVAFIDDAQDGWFCGTGSLIIRLKKNYNGKLYTRFFSDANTVKYLEKSSRGVTMANLNLDIIQNLPIPNIPKSEQQKIVKEIEQEQQLVNANKELIKIYEQKIKDEINKLWQPAVKEYKIEEEKLTVAAEG